MRCVIAKILIFGDTLITRLMGTAGGKVAPHETRNSLRHNRTSDAGSARKKVVY